MNHRLSHKPLPLEYPLVLNVREKKAESLTSYINLNFLMAFYIIKT